MLIKEECPLNGIEYRFDEVEINGSVESWQACGKLCQQTEGCDYWYWQNYFINECFMGPNISYIKEEDRSVAGRKTFLKQFIGITEWLTEY